MEGRNDFYACRYNASTTDFNCLEGWFIRHNPKENEGLRKEYYMLVTRDIDGAKTIEQIGIYEGEIPFPCTEENDEKVINFLNTILARTLGVLGMGMREVEKVVNIPEDEQLTAEHVAHIKTLNRIYVDRDYGNNEE